MSDILFISPSSKGKRIDEGFLQRISEIDSLFTDCKRTYVDIRFKTNFKKRVIYDDNLTVYYLNWLFHFPLIIKFLNKFDKIYIHSIYSGFRVFPYIFFSKIKKSKVCLELHGTFQEELTYKGEKFNPIIFGLIEKMLLKWSKFIVFVSKPFEDYFLKKYPFISNAQRYIIPTCTSKVFEHFDQSKNELIKEKFQISNNDVVFVYSGSTEVWQKIDLMMSLIKKLIETNPNYKFFLLTANLDIMIEKAKSNNIYPNKNINILHIPPEELGNYYSISHYGFVLRDEHILNEVASPTKLLEYLYFGLTPILKSTKLGDFINYKIDYLTIDKLDSTLPPSKSERNKEIAKQILQNYKAQLLRLKKDFLS